MYLDMKIKCKQLINILDMLYEKNQQMGEFSTNNFKIHKSANTELQIGRGRLYMTPAYL